MERPKAEQGKQKTNQMSMTTQKKKTNHTRRTKDKKKSHPE